MRHGTARPISNPRCTSHPAQQVSHIETEKLLIKLVGAELARRKAAGTYRGKFSAVSHFFGCAGCERTPGFQGWQGRRRMQGGCCALGFGWA